MAREKKKVIANISKEAADEAFALYADAAGELAKIEATMNEEINGIRDKYQERIGQLETLKEQKFAVLQVFAIEQKDGWGKRKSLDMLHGKIGFRTGTHKLKCDKGFNWTSVTALLNEYYPDYVRTITETNKEKLIGDRDTEGFEDICKKAHVKIAQDETFFVEPKTEQLQTA